MSDKGSSPNSQTPDKALLEMLVCPVTRTLHYDFRGANWFQAAKLAYPIRDGIPIMPEEARPLRLNAFFASAHWGCAL